MPMAPGPLSSASGAADAGPDSRWVDDAAPSAQPRGFALLRRLQQHRLAVLAAGTLLGVAFLLGWLQWLGAQAHLPGRWAAAPGQGLVLQAAPAHSALQGQVGRTLLAIAPHTGVALPASTDWLAARPRWIAADERREAWQAGQQVLVQALGQARWQAPAGGPATALSPATAAAPSWVLRFDGGEALAVQPVPRGIAGLGLACWILGLLALGLYLSALLVGLTQPGRPAALYAVLALAQALMLALAGAEALPGLGQPLGPWPAVMALWGLAETAAAAALVQLLWQLTRTPPPQRRLWPMLSPVLSPVLWGGALAVALVVASGLLPAAPLLLTLCSLASLLAAAALLRAAARRDGLALASHLQPLAVGACLGLVALAAAWWWWGDAAAGRGSALLQLAPVWAAAFGTAVLAGPLLARPRQSLREWVVVVALASLALLLALLLHAGLDLPGPAALLIGLALAATAFAAARPLIDRHLAGIGTLSAERLFDSLYRAARALEQAPQRSGELVAQLLREVFDPLEVSRNGRPLSRVRVARDGSAMAVPVPELDEGMAPGRGQRTVVLRHARRGQRRFTEDDRQLAERLLEQLRRAVAYDRAVERGRAEERSRIAQDLHDDIGARLLTLMYKAPDSGIEEYIRHTLQDLKTLTRGLAAANQRLSHAAAEWKADISQRLHPSGCDLHWSFSAERDITLNAMQWSGLTRMLRELVNNILAHAEATQVEIGLQFDGQWLSLQVTDDGLGRAPEAWSHGLGLGGVRKRVKQLGGQVQWREHGLRGIRCDIRVRLDNRPDGPATPTAHPPPAPPPAH